MQTQDWLGAASASVPKIQVWYTAAVKPQVAQAAHALSPLGMEPSCCCDYGTGSSLLHLA